MAVCTQLYEWYRPEAADGLLAPESQALSGFEAPGPNRGRQYIALVCATRGTAFDGGNRGTATTS